MHASMIETQALLRVAVEAAERAGAIAARRASRFKRLDRVVFQFGAGEWTHATVWELTIHPVTGETCAWLRLAGGGFHCEPVDSLVLVCGVCPDCVALNQQPGCMA